MASDCVYGEIVPQHTHTHTDNIHILSCVCVRGSHVLLLSVSVGRLVVCVCFVCMGLCCPHTRYSGLCCCCLAGCCPPSSGGAGCTACTLNSIMPCLCVDTISYIWCVCVCVSRTHTHTHPRHHQPSPTPAHASAYEHGTVYAPLLLLLLQQHSFMIVVVVVVIILYIPASSRATVPAEFKHINKRRKRNQQGFP